jgi:hypothetical protein
MIPSTSHAKLSLFRKSQPPIEPVILILDTSYRSIWYSINGQEDCVNSPQLDFSSSLNGKRYMSMDEHIKNVLELDREISDEDRVEYIKKERMK